MGSDYHLQQSINAVNIQRSQLIALDAARLIAGNRWTEGKAIHASIEHEEAEQEASLDERGVHQVEVPRLRFEGNPSKAQISAVARRILPSVQRQMGVELDDEA